MNREEVLRKLAGEESGARAGAAAQLQAAGLRIVANRERDAVEVEATLDMWEYPHAVQLWGRKRLPVVDPTEVLAKMVQELDPVDGRVLTDGFNHHTAADWNGVSDELRSLVRYGVKHGRLPITDPIDLADQLRRGELSARLKMLQTEATPDELAEAGNELRRLKPNSLLISPEPAEAEHRRSARLIGGGVEWRTLTDFLADAFEPSELRRFVGSYYHRCVNGVNWYGSPKTVAFCVVTELRNHGVLHGAFWNAGHIRGAASCSASISAARPGRSATNRLDQPHGAPYTERMNAKYYPHLLTLLLIVAWLSFGSGCCWEEPIQIGNVAESIDSPVAESIDSPATPEIVQAQCDTELGGGDLWAVADFPARTELELGMLHVIGRGGSHHAMQVSNIIILPEKAAVICTDYSPPLVSATFILKD